MTESTATQLKQIRRKYQIFRGTEILLWSVCISCLTFYLLRVFTPWPAAAACFTGCVSAFVGIRRLNLFSITNSDLAHYLNRNYPILRESADLLLRKPEELTHLQQIQRIRTITKFYEIYPSIKLPHRIGRAVVVFVFSVMAGIASSSFLGNPEKTGEAKNSPERKSFIEKKNFPTSVKAGIITVYPPGYTKIKKTSTQDFNLRIPEGSMVTWDIAFEKPVSDPQLIVSGRDTIAFSRNGKKYDLRYTCSESGFYQLSWKNEDGSYHYSEYYKLEVAKDKPPAIVIENLNQFLELGPNDNVKINLSSILTDDYGISRAHIIATVSKGSGEAIKFREQKLSFDKPRGISGKTVHTFKIIDLVDLGLHPGDELYFYIEAFDVKEPKANVARTETYFIALRDTSTIMTSVEASLGANLVPEYFRSQRQIIIDSEKLLKEKNRIAIRDFTQRSNELAHDQKVLRLRYGEFLGEEFESAIGPQQTVSPIEDGEDVGKKFGHEHDRANEGGPVGGVEKDEENHLHRGAETNTGQKQDPLKEFLHAHDDEEEATFFTQSIKAKLKAAVAIMWDAELYLRLIQPEKSLPYQYSALKLLKEISLDSRIYVHRTGFDPPPLKEEKRLTGDLSEINNSIAESMDKKSVESYENIRRAIITIEGLMYDESISLSEHEKNNLIAAGRELAILELKKPGGYLKTLSRLKMVTQDEIYSDEVKNVLANIRSSLWKALPQQTIQPQPSTGITHELDLEFLKSLEQSDPDD